MEVVEVNDSSQSEDDNETEQEIQDANCQSAMQGGEQSQDYEEDVEDLVLNDENPYLDEDDCNDWRVRGERTFCILLVCIVH